MCRAVEGQGQKSLAARVSKLVNKQDKKPAISSKICTLEVYEMSKKSEGKEIEWMV